MPIAKEKLKQYEDIEKELGGGNLLPEGTYLFKVLEPEIAEANGFPRLRLPFEVQAPKALEGRQQSEFLGWFVPEVSEHSDKPYEERLRGSRGATYGFLDALLEALENSPTSTDEIATTIIDARRLMWKDDTQTSEAFQVIADALVDQEFFAKIKHRTNKLTEKKEAKLYPMSYDKGMKALRVDTTPVKV